MILEANNIFSGYGKLEILHGVSICVQESKVTSLLGPNGAGKSTLLKTIFGYLKPKRGSIIFDGEDITALSPENILRKGASYVPQGRSVFPLLTVLENLKMGGYVLKDRKKLRNSIEEAFEKFPILKARKNQLAGSLSGGEQRMLEFARALMLRPKLIMFDEPSLGLAPKIVNESFAMIDEMKVVGTTVLLVEQNVREALNVSDYTYILKLGRNTLEGKSLSEIDLAKIYLG